MAAYARGERSAFDELFTRHATRVYQISSRGMRRPEDAKDLVQQTFLQVHRHRADYDPSRAFRPWLCTIAMNVKRQYLRTKGRRPESELDGLVERTLVQAPGQNVFESRQLLEMGLRRLPAEVAEIVVLHWFGQLSMSEIATVMALSESAVKVRAHRAYEALRHLLTEERSEVEPVSREGEALGHGEAGRGEARYDKSQADAQRTTAERNPSGSFGITRGDE